MALSYTCNPEINILQIIPIIKCLIKTAHLSGSSYSDSLQQEALKFLEITHSYMTILDTRSGLVELPQSNGIGDPPKVPPVSGQDAPYLCRHLALAPDVQV